MLSLDPTPDLLTTIIVPAHNCWELTEACIDSVRKNTLAQYEVVLVDDASDEKTARKMAGLVADDLCVLRNETRCSFSANNNRAAESAKGKYLCLLNNDTLVTPGWLKAMVSVAEADPGIGVLGNRHLFPGTNLLHHCGMAFDKDGHPQHLHPHTEPDAPAANYQRDVQAVTFACVLIPKTVYVELGGLDESYLTGHEDCDFCLRAQETGYRVTYSPASTIYHHGQQTPGRKEYDSDNSERFLGQWGGRVRKDFETTTLQDRRHNQAVARHPSSSTVSGDGVHFAVDFTTGSAFSWATVELALALLECGENVSVPPTFTIDSKIGFSKARVIRGLRKRKPYETFHLKWSHYWPNCMNQKLFGDINAEFFCTNYRYRDERRLDHWMRQVTANDYRKVPISDFSMDALAEVGIPANRRSTMPLGYSPEIDRIFPEGRPALKTGDELHLLAVTNSHDLYRYGTDLLVDAVSDAFGPEDNVVLHIKDYAVGMAASPIEEWIGTKKKFPRVEWHRGFLSKAELMRLYARMDVLVAPFRGEGFGMKILDAMAIGIPTMIPAFGGPEMFAVDGGFLPLPHAEVPVGPCFDRANGYMGEGAYWCEADRSSFLEQLESLRDRRQELIDIGESARRYVRERFSWRNAAEGLMRSLREWQGERLVEVTGRRMPSELPLSVVIPTKDREENLSKALDAYRSQTLPADKYEILIVNDHGRADGVADAAKKHEDHLAIRLLSNSGPKGPASARNLGVKASKGDIVLITGDDIVPSPQFLEEHILSHEKFPGLESAIIGKTEWHPDLSPTAFMDHLCGEGGQQFNYHGMRNQRIVPFDRFYTCNVSLKRDFLIEEELLFSVDFPYAAYEDIELAYRLHLRGMELRFCSAAVGFHDHATDLEAFIKRQFTVGRMLVLLSLKQPSFIPPAHKDFLKAFEFLRCSPDVSELLTSDEGRGRDESHTSFTSYLAEADATLFRTIDIIGRSPQDMDTHLLMSWLKDGGQACWGALNEFVLRQGMAEEWGSDEEESSRYRQWAALMSFTSMFRGSPRSDSIFDPVRRPNSSALFPASRFVYFTEQALRSTPLIGSLLRRFEESRVGIALRASLMKKLGRL